MGRILLATLLVLSSAACVSTPIVPAIPSADLPLPASVRVQVVEHGVAVIKVVPLEEYVQATAISEVAPAVGDVATVERMLEVQTIISRTYAVSHLGRHTREGFDLCSTTHCQLFEPRRLQTSKWAAASAEAVARTAGLILTFDRQPIQALFHADCGGYTSTSSAVWGGIDRPYLVARPDDGVGTGAHTTWQYQASADVLTAALDADSRTRIAGRLDAIDVIGRDGAGRAERIALAGRGEKGAASVNTIVRGDELRQVLTKAFGPRAIRSTWFDVQSSGGVFVFAGRGYGHGVGLCQAGAFARLRDGATPADVVRHYYPGAVMAQGLGVRAQAWSPSNWPKILQSPPPVTSSPAVSSSSRTRRR